MILPKVQTFNSAPSLTQQQFKEEADINNIIASYNTTGLLTNPLVQSARQPMFGDFSNLPQDYMQLQNQLLQAQADFMDLPAKIRQRFNNNPAELIAFLQNSDNIEEAVELGLMEKFQNRNQNRTKTGTAGTCRSRHTIKKCVVVTVLT